MNVKFALIGHHLSEDLLYKNLPHLSGRSLTDIKKILVDMPPMKLTDLEGVETKTGEKIHGFGVVINLLPDQFYELDPKIVVEKIVEAVNLAKELGAGIVVLGAATAVVGDQGVAVSQKVKQVAITTGNSYTAAMTIEAVKKGSKILNLDLKKSTVTIVGATGSIGSACAHILSELSNKLVLVARNQRRLKELAETLKAGNRAQVEVAENGDIKKAAAQSNVIITVTSAPYALIDAEDFRSGSLVCDVAIPRNISLKSGKLRNDVLIIDGGLIKPPGNLQKSDFDIDMPAGTAPACLSEGIILAIEKRFENFTIGHGIDINKVKEIYQLGKKNGFKLAGLRSFGKILTQEYLEQFSHLNK